VHSRAWSIESFAALVAALDDPFGERAAVLAAHGLDEARLAALVDTWRAQIRDDAGAMQPRFARAYRAVRGGRPEQTLAISTEPRAGVSETLGAGPAASAPLPFGRAPSPGFPGTPARTTPSGVGTGTLAAEVGGAPNPPLPFEPSAPSADLTLEQYAAFRAALGVAPANREALYATFGIRGEGAQSALDELWRRRFASDRALQRRFVELAAAERDALLEKSRA
jgi:hypothetical protein